MYNLSEGKIKSILNNGLTRDDPNLARQIPIKSYEYNINKDLLEVELRISRYNNLYTYIVNNKFYAGDNENTGSRKTILVYFEVQHAALGPNQQLI